MKIRKKFFHDGAVFKPGMEVRFLTTSPTKARQRDLKKRGYIDFDEAVPVVKPKSTLISDEVGDSKKSNSEKEE